MELERLRLRPQEQKMLEDMGLNTVEKVSLCWRDDLGLGKRKGDDIITRARNVLAYDRIIAVDTDSSDCGIDIMLSDTSKPTIGAVEHVLGIWSDDLLRTVDDERKSLSISSPRPGPCSTCGAAPTHVCRICRVSLCDECRPKHAHFQSIETRHLDEMFARVMERAQSFVPMPKEKRADADTVPSRKVMDIAIEKGFSGFAEGFFAELYGNEVMKKSLACALFSTPQEPVHVLVVGDPAGGKTLARDIMVRGMGSDVELVGANATRAGLVCSMASGQLGVLAYADGKLVLADEFDKIPDQDVEYCYELLSNGKCSVHSARMHETIESRFIMIAFANPVNTVFIDEPIQEIGLPPILLSRFALIVKADELEEVYRKELIKRKLLGYASDLDSAGGYIAWLRESRKHTPKLTVSDEEIDSYVNRVNGIIERFINSPLRRDNRTADYAKRVAMSIARANFSDIDGRMLEEAAGLIEASIATWNA